ncbi:hypothetical protein [Marinifilum fragile]|uniref:hypothetical protein n=1 Tax=Marinifilum fragile TaxID=570161 RepID=UPI002AA7A923|nr:hypothetical protein [Marinifilum fragile]
MNKLILIIIFLIPIQLIAQINYDEIKSKNFYSTKIDTTNEKVLYVEMKYAIIIFKQSDLDSILKNADNSSEIGSFRYFEKCDNLLKLFQSNKQKIKLTDYWFDYGDEDREKMFGNINYSNPDKKPLGELIYIGGDLIHDGKAMIIEKKNQELVTKKMKIKRVNGLYGTRYVEFRLPNKKSFWRIITRLGE